MTLETPQTTPQNLHPSLTFLLYGFCFANFFPLNQDCDKKIIKKKKPKGRKLNGIQRQKKNCKTHVGKLEKIAPAKKVTKKKAGVAAIPHKEIISAYEQQRKLDRYQDVINRRIDYIQMRSCAEQLAKLEAQREKFNFQKLFGTKNVWFNEI